MSERLAPAQLRALPSTAILIRRSRFRLTLRKRIDGAHMVDVFSCRVSIGAMGFETPAGSTVVLAKAKNPDWTKPFSDWVPKEEQGQTIPGGDPANPIKAAFIKLTDDGIGIHGTATFPLGQKASHGCIRVRPEDALEIYELVELGSPVTII